VLTRRRPGADSVRSLRNHRIRSKRPTPQRFKSPQQSAKQCPAHKYARPPFATLVFQQPSPLRLYAFGPGHRAGCAPPSHHLHIHRKSLPTAMDAAGVDLSTTFGALALGSVLCTVFWSFLVVQTCVTSPPSKMRHSHPMQSVLPRTVRVSFRHSAFADHVF
jgi:hypothetical protein